MSSYDTSRLQDLGRKRQRLTIQLAKIEADLEASIPAAAAEVSQIDIARWTGYTRESIRTKCLTDEQREAEREQRRKRTRKNS